MGGHCVGAKRCATQQGVPLRATCQLGGSRPHLDHGLCHTQPRLHDLRHLVFGRRQGQGAAANGAKLQHQQRRQAMDFQAALRLGLSRWQAGHQRRRGGLAQTLVQSRRHGQCFVWLHRPPGNTRRQHLSLCHERALCHRARSLGQSLQQCALHHAGPHRRHTRHRTDQRAHRFGPVHFQSR